MDKDEDEEEEEEESEPASKFICESAANLRLPSSLPSIDGDDRRRSREGMREDGGWRR